MTLCSATTSALMPWDQPTDSRPGLSVIHIWLVQVCLVGATILSLLGSLLALSVHVKVNKLCDEHKATRGSTAHKNDLESCQSHRAGKSVSGNINVIPDVSHRQLGL